MNCKNCGKQINDNDELCKDCKPSSLWYALALIFGIFGGGIVYFILKNKDNAMANRILALGAIISTLGIVIIGSTKNVDKFPNSINQTKIPTATTIYSSTSTPIDIKEEIRPKILNTASPIETSQIPKTPITQYSILKEEIDDIPIKTQIVLHILVTGEITEQGLRNLLNELYLDTNKRTGFKNHDNPTHIFIYAYLSKEYFESGMGQWIAMLKKIGDDQPKIEINNIQISQLNTNSEEKFGMTEEQRKQIYVEIIKTERMGKKEKKYTMICQKNMD